MSEWPARIDHITPMLHKLQWLPICDRILIVHKISKYTLSDFLYWIRPKLPFWNGLYTPSRSLRSSSVVFIHILEVCVHPTPIFIVCTGQQLILMANIHLHIKCHMSGTNFLLTWGTNLTHLPLNLHFLHTFPTQMVRLY